MRLAIVVPCYNEEPVLPDTTKQLSKLLEQYVSKGIVSYDSFVLYVDDGSRDNTWKLIEEASNDSKYIQGLKLAGNVGHQNALLAGLMTVRDEIDAAVSIDADLQDDINVIEEMVSKYKAGCDIVYGVRSARKKDTFFKRFTAQGFYRVMNLMGAKSVYNHADFRCVLRGSLLYVNRLAEAEFPL